MTSMTFPPGGCCVCSDEIAWDENPLVYCDGPSCNVAVHQACYGILTVPSGPWYCRKCESPEKSTRVKCDLCPSRDGALKRTDQNAWAHVVCALYIPEVRFGNVSSMEPIITSLVPPERFGKSCLICEANGKGSKATMGACMQCNKPFCKAYFHVTCAQMAGQLCEEAGNQDNVKYCGYCQYHCAKLKSNKNVKIIPPFRPVPARDGTRAGSPSSSPEKTISKPGSSNDDKIPSSSTSKNGTPSTAGDYIPAKKTGSSHSMSPDIDSSSNSKNSKNSKKSNGGNHNSGSRSDSSLSTLSSKSSSSSITPKIAQPVLTGAAFSSSIHLNKIAESKEGDDKSERNKIDQALKDDNNFTVKFERVDNPLSKGAPAQSNKKEYSTLQVKEVMTSDRPLSGGSKFDHGHGGSADALASSSSAHSGRHSDKPAPPDIKPHVTLTPIPMRGSSSGASSSSRLSLGGGEDREDKDRESGNQGNKSSPVNSSTLSFHSSGSASSYGTKGQVSTTMSEGDPKPKQTAELSPPELPVYEKTGPPSKRSRGSSRDDDRGRKTPTKGRGGGRRGSSNSGYHKRDNAFVDENSHDEPMDIVSSGSTRGGRAGGPGRKTAGSRLVGNRSEDPPAPTLSQLKAQMDSANAESGGGGNTLGGVLPTHMFGNALNPASSMAQRMVDTLSQEMEAVAAAGVAGIQDSSSPPAPLIGIPLPGKASASVTTNGSSNSHTGNSGNGPPQTLEQLLERQWEQGSQFLMEQAQHLDIAQLLSCLNQLKQDNKALEEHVQSLIQRRDQLIAINARLSIPLGSSSALGSLGPVFNSSVNGSSQNGHGTPPPNNQPQGSVIPHPNVPKGLQVNPSTPSPQHQHELIMQSRHRDERMYHSEMQVSRAEITASHPTASPHGPPSHNSRQHVAPYGYPGPTHNSSGHPHSSHQHHSHGRDGPR